MQSPGLPQPLTQHPLQRRKLARWPILLALVAVLLALPPIAGVLHTFASHSEPLQTFAARIAAWCSPRTARDIKDAHARLADYPDLSAYRAANAALLPATPARIIFFGDSITEHWASPAFSSFFQLHPDFIGRGISGQNTSQLLLRFHADALDLHPSTIVLLAGTNDINQDTSGLGLKLFADNMESMVDLAQAKGIRVVLCTIPPVDPHALRPLTHPEVRIPAYNAWIEKFAAARNLDVADYHQQLADSSGALRASVTDDGVHPNRIGYQLMEPDILNLLQPRTVATRR